MLYVHEIMAGFDPSAAIKPVVDAGYVYGHVAEAIFRADRGYPLALVPDPYHWSWKLPRPSTLDLTGVELLLDPPEDPVRELGLAEVERKPRFVPDSKETVYWPVDRFRAEVENEVRRAIGDWRRARALRALGLRLDPGLYGVLHQAYRVQDVLVAQVGRLEVRLWRSPETWGKGWKILVIHGTNVMELAELALPGTAQRALPWGLPEFEVAVRVPADPFAASVSFYVWRRGERRGNVIAGEVNIPISGPPVVHQPAVMEAEEADRARTRPRIGDLVLAQGAESLLDEPNLVPSVPGTWLAGKFTPAVPTDELVTFRHRPRNGGSEEHPAVMLSAPVGFRVLRYIGTSHD